MVRGCFALQVQASQARRVAYLLWGIRLAGRGRLRVVIARREGIVTQTGGRSSQKTAQAYALANT